MAYLAVLLGKAASIHLVREIEVRAEATNAELPQVMACGFGLPGTRNPWRDSARRTTFELNS